MSKDEKKRCNCTCQCKKNEENEYYLAIIDLTFQKVHYDVFNKRFVYADCNEDGELLETPPSRANTYRFFNRTFSKSIADAALKAIMACKETNEENVEEMNGKYPLFSAFDPDNIMNHLEWDPEIECFVFEAFQTIGTRNYPKDCQWDKFFTGEYEFFVERYEIQILKTELTKISESVLKELSKGIQTRFHVTDGEDAGEISISSPQLTTLTFTISE
jgi:hypothetical protein